MKVTVTVTVMDEPQFSTRVGKRLTAARIKSDHSMRQAAEHSGVSRPTIANIEGGVFSPSAYNVLRLCRLYGCKIEDILK